MDDRLTPSCVTCTQRNDLALVLELLFSPDEAHVVEALVHGNYHGRALARVTGLGYSSGFRTLVANMVEKGAIDWRAGIGYTLPAAVLDLLQRLHYQPSLHYVQKRLVL